MRKTNGFSPPLHPFQIITWVIVACHILIPFLFDFRRLPESPQLIFFILHYLSLLFILVLGILVTKSNPGINTFEAQIELSTTPGATYCNFCVAYTKKCSKHCGQCNKCIDNIDHHCKWLNNCIGQKNYSLFIGLIISVNTNAVILEIFEFILLANEFKDKYIAIIFDMFVNFIIIFSVTFLLGFHIFLKWKGLSTFDYIKQKRIENVKRKKSLTVLTEKGVTRKDEIITKITTLGECNTNHKISKSNVEKVPEWSIISSDGQVQSSFISLEC